MNQKTIISLIGITIFLSISSILIISAQMEELQTLATICGDNAIMSFVPEEVQAINKIASLASCVQVVGCVTSLAENKVKSAAIAEVLSNLDPKFMALVETYKSVNGLIETGSTIAKGCLKVDKDGLVNEMDEMEIKADKNGNSQDISRLLYGKSSTALKDEQKIYGKNVKISKAEGEDFIMGAENSLVKINGKEANLASGYIEIERTEDEEGNIVMNVRNADVIIGEGDGTLKFGDYEGTFKEGTHVLFDSATGFTFPEGQEGQTAEIVDKSGRTNSLILKDYEVSAQISDGGYKIEGKNFEINGMKVYRENDRASLIIKENSYVKGKDTFVETNGMKIGGGEIDIWLDGEKHTGDYFSISENEVIARSRQYETSLEILDKKEKLSVIADKNSRLTIKNQNGGIILKDGKAQAIIGTRAGAETTPLDINIESIEDKKEYGIQMDSEGTMEVEKCTGITSGIIGKVIQLTGFASNTEACMTKVSVNLDSAIKFSINKDNPRAGKVYDSTEKKWVDVIQLKSGQWVDAQAKADPFMENIVKREIYVLSPDGKKAVKIAYQTKQTGSSDRDYSAIQPYRGYEETVTSFQTLAQPAAPADLNKEIKINVKFTGKVEGTYGVNKMALSKNIEYLRATGEVPEGSADVIQKWLKGVRIIESDYLILERDQAQLKQAGINVEKLLEKSQISLGYTSVATIRE